MLITAALLPLFAGAPAWKLVWADEFNVPGAPDPKKWIYEEGFVRNNEAQYYTKNRRENARVEGGKLIIEARKDNFLGHPISSAALETQGLADWTYGKIEVRAKIPTGKGSWPAIWTLGSNINKVGWPACGEIDMMENVGFDPDRMHFNFHQPKDSEAPGSQKSSNFLATKPYADFHTYTMQWYPDRVELFMDGALQLTYKNDNKNDDATWPYHLPQFILLNLAIGGAWGGQQGIDDAIFPCRMEVDYVRVYQSPTTPSPR